MSWFNASQLSSFAKQALSQAQKSIDRVLDIQEEEPGAWAEPVPYGEPGKGRAGPGPRGVSGRRASGEPLLPGRLARSCRPRVGPRSVPRESAAPRSSLPEALGARPEGLG